MVKIGICGHFANGQTSYNGQTIKTINVSSELEKKYLEENILKVDTYNWKKHPLRLFINCIKLAKKSDDIIIFPAHKGVKIFVPLFVYLKKIFKFKLHYIVIGGWLPSLVKDNDFIKKNMKKIDCIYIENYKMVEELKKIGIDNSIQMNNFKNLKVTETKKRNNDNKFKCCIFSRIEEKKGINEAIDVIDELNFNGNIKVELDIYGKISDIYKNEFYNKIKNKDKYIKYCGVVNSTKSVEVIENYDLLLFPTKYFTEGIPGTIIDAYFSKVPVLASRWENFDEIIDEGKTGFGFEFDNKEDFKNKLSYLIYNKNILMKMKENCGKKALFYTPAESMKVLFNNIDD